MNAVTKMENINESAEKMEITYIPMQQIVNNPKNRDLDESTIRQIADSFDFTGGLLQAIEVSPVDDGYMVTDGHHRYAACELAGLTEVPCVVVTLEQDEDRFLRSLIPNISRREMSYSEKVKVMAHLAETSESEIDPKSIARKLGIRPANAAEMVYVAELPAELVEKADTNNAYRARFHKFARLPKSNRDIITENIVKLHEGMGKWVTPEQFDVALSKLTLSIEHACFDTTECLRCPRNTNCQTGLFADAGDAEEGTCTNASCYQLKERDAISKSATREAEKFAVPAENITIYTGDQNVTTDTVPVTFNGGTVNARPWHETDLNENAAGCEGCQCRIVVTQKLPGRVASVCACTKGSCYSNLMPKGAVETGIATDTTEAKAGTAAPTTATKPNEKVKAAKKDFDGKLTSKCVIDYRRKMLDAHVVNSVPKADPLARMKAAVLIMSASSVEVKGLMDEALDTIMTTANPQDVANALVQIIKDSVPTLHAANMKKLYALVTNNEDFKAAWTHKDANFLSGLNRAELLALLDRAGASSDEDFWKEAKKAKKGNAESGLVSLVLNHDLNGFVPEEVMIDKI